jgi:hemerythrin superfamily protein
MRRLPDRRRNASARFSLFVFVIETQTLNQEIVMGTKSQMATGRDVVAYLKNQHEQIKGLFAQVIAATGEERKRVFYDLRSLMAVHETAEEQIVHPVAAKKLGPAGATAVDARLAEERKAKLALIALEQLDVTSEEFETKIRALQGDVLAHAQSEEREEFDKLGEALDSTHLARMKKAVELVEAVAPTRPHPGIESPLANMFVGPFASVIDRTRDALTMKH